MSRQEERYKVFLEIITEQTDLTAEQMRNMAFIVLDDKGIKDDEQTGAVD